MNIRQRHARLLLSTIFFLFISFDLFSQSRPSAIDALKEEVRQTEKQFEADVNARGADFAFEKYAAPNAVIKRRNDSLIYGPKAIRNFYSSDNYKNGRAYWTPDYIDVSADGTLAYTFGKYQWNLVDKSGKVQEYHGIFHTVWKKQPDGSWKYVWD